MLSVVQTLHGFLSPREGRPERGLPCLLSVEQCTSVNTRRCKGVVYLSPSARVALPRATTLADMLEKPIDTNANGRPIIALRFWLSVPLRAHAVHRLVPSL